MKITYDPKADAVNVTFREGKVRESVEIAPEIILDLDSQSRPLYLEILGAKKKLGKESVEEFVLKNLAVADRN